VQQPMTSTDLLVAGVIAALLAPFARLYEIKAALGVVIVCVALATTMEVMMATTVAKRMTNGRENFWIRILIAFILFGSLLCWFSCGAGLFTAPPLSQFRCLMSILNWHSASRNASRCASATKIVRPLESTAETQPQLQPALLRLLAI